jgi:hypothetical protein
MPTRREAAGAKPNAFDRTATLGLAEHWKALGTNVFNLGGLIGTLLTIPAAKVMGRRKMQKALGARSSGSASFRSSASCWRSRPS